MTFGERWDLMTNRQRAEYLMGMTNLPVRVTEGDMRYFAAAQVYATLALTDEKIEGTEQ